MPESPGDGRRNWTLRLAVVAMVLALLVAFIAENFVFVEVRHRQRSDYGSPLETITPAKQRRIIKAARFYLHAQRLSCPCRFDVVGVTGSPPMLEFDWIRAAFDAY